MIVPDGMVDGIIAAYNSYTKWDDDTLVALLDALDALDEWRLAHDRG